MLALLARSALAGEPVHEVTVAEKPWASSPASSADVQRARELFQRGVELARQALWLEALAAFRASLELKSHPVTWFNVAYSERALGHYTRALQAFRQALAQPEANAVAELPKTLRDGAREYVQDLEKQLVTVSIKSEQQNYRLLIDGRPLEHELSGAQSGVSIAGTRPPGPAETLDRTVQIVLMDPGTHRFQWSGPGLSERTFSRRFEPGETASVWLAVGGEAPSGSGKVRLERRSAPERGHSLVGPILLGAGGVAIAAGSVLGIVAWKKKSNLDESCPNKQCSASEDSDLAAARRYADISSVSFGIGLVAIVTGGVLVLTGHSETARASAGRSLTELPKPREGIRVELGLGGARLSSRF